MDEPDRPASPGATGVRPANVGKAASLALLGIPAGLGAKASSFGYDVGKAASFARPRRQSCQLCPAESEDAEEGSLSDLGGPHHGFFSAFFSSTSFQNSFAACSLIVSRV